MIAFGPGSCEINILRTTTFLEFQKRMEILMRGKKLFSIESMLKLAYSGV